MKEKVKLRHNTSKVYYNGRKFPTLRCGELTIIGQCADPVMRMTKGKLYPNYCKYLVRFEDDTEIVAYNSHIRTGNVKNPNTPVFFNQGYSGVGPHKIYNGNIATREGVLWMGILSRCYQKDVPEKRPTYVDCVISEEWKCFQNFCKDLPFLVGYNEWLSSCGKDYHLDKDIKVPGNKVYSKDTCMFVPASVNIYEASLTGKVYKAIRIKDSYTELFRCQTEFARKYELNYVCVNNCLQKKQPTHKGWKFEILEELN